MGRSHRTASVTGSASARPARCWAVEQRADLFGQNYSPLGFLASWRVNALSMAVPLLCRFAPHAGFVTLRQTVVRRGQNREPNLDDEEDNHEGTSRALRRPFRVRNANALLVR